MKGVILAGGNGTRLMPLTSVTNKSLLPVYDRPMIHYPIQMLVKAGIDELLLVTGGKTCGDMIRVLGDGASLGLRSLYYTVQEQAGGISHALSLAKHFAKGDKIFVVLGDNLIFGHDFEAAVHSFKNQDRGAHVFLQPVPDPERFGVAQIEHGRIVSIEEKPRHPKSNLAVTGLYMYDETVFDKIAALKPSARGELEITDLNKLYLQEGTLGYEKLSGDWIDAGTFDSFLEASKLAKQLAEASTLANHFSLRQRPAHLEVAA
jgi:glucose-1-phosphate thymidylyltransferase